MDALGPVIGTPCVALASSWVQWGDNELCLPTQTSECDYEDGAWWWFG